LSSRESAKPAIAAFKSIYKRRGYWIARSSRAMTKLKPGVRSLYLDFVPEAEAVGDMAH
jgi:hypothetical protein